METRAAQKTGGSDRVKPCPYAKSMLLVPRGAPIRVDVILYRSLSSTRKKGARITRSSPGEISIPKAKLFDFLSRKLLPRLV